MIVPFARYEWIGEWWQHSLCQPYDYNAKIAIYKLWFVNQLYFSCDLKRDWVVSRRRLLDPGWAAGQDADRRVKVHKHELFQGDHEPDPCARTNTLHLSLSARIWWQTLSIATVWLTFKYSNHSVLSSSKTNISIYKITLLGKI